MSAGRRRLPPGFGIALDPRVRRLEGGRVLIGGSPLRLLRLSDAGARSVHRLAGGAAVPAAGPEAPLARRLLDAGMAHPRPAPRRRTGEGVAVVLPVRDRPAELARALAGIDPVADLVVIDDGSVDAAAVAAIAARSGARVLRHPRPRGPAAARNRGLAATRTPVVAFIDSDCELAPGWLEGLLAHLDDPAVGLVAPRIAGPAPGRGDGLLARYERVRSPLDMGPREAAVTAGGTVPYVPAAVLLVRREAAAAAGGFDEAMRVGEDVDFVWRLTAAGWLARYEPAVRARHPARSPGDWLWRRVAYGTSAAALARRHPGHLAAVELTPAAAAVWGLLLLARPGLALAWAAMGALRLGRRLPLRRPWGEAVRLSAAGHHAVARRLAEQAVRSWWPLALAAAVRWPAARRGLAACALLPGLAEWWRRRPDLDPARYCALRTVDAVAYGAGVWLGCLRERTAAPLLPRLRTRGGDVRLKDPSPSLVLSLRGRGSTGHHGRGDADGTRPSRP
jgi:mycofactocin glycosyltransferase